MCDLTNGLGKGLRRMYDQMRPHQDDPQYFSTTLNY